MDRVFLDANVLFSAVYKEGAGLARLWHLDGLKLISSAYALIETRLNLADPSQHERLSALLQAIAIVPAGGAIPPGIELPVKDVPILASAFAAKATHLLTGDQRHFGALYGREISGCLIQRPADFLRMRQRS
jgi:uncharacterized protein